MEREELGWVRSQIHEWRIRVSNGTKLKPVVLSNIIERIEEAGVARSLTCFVILGCEWMFRLRESGPQDTERLLARVEVQLAAVLDPDDAWIVVEALSESIGTLMKRRRMLATELEPEASKFFVGEPLTVAAPRHRPPRTPPPPLILPRRGPIPWPAPWIAGVIVERLLQEFRPTRATVKARVLALEVTSALCGRQVDEKDYRIRRQSLEGAALDKLVEDFKHLHHVLASLDMQPPRRWPQDWFRVLADKLQFGGPRNTFPYHLATMIELFTAYRTSAGKRGAKNPGRGAC
jgi:hypothetical protein